MQSLPAALAPLAQYRQFLVYELQPDPKRPGKTNKYPIDINTGKRHDAHDASIWTDAQTACTMATLWGPGYGVGFTFTEADPFFFIDVDECLLPDGSGWTPIVAELCAQFAGAAVEVSQSGRGLHIIACGRAPTHRRCKDTTGKLFDLYTEKRFVALTGWNAYGDVWTDHTPALHALAEKWLQVTGADGATDGDLTTAPCPEWRGSTDDDDLIRRALQSHSASSAFGGGAAFADLWQGNVEALARAYPTNTVGAAYDASAADQALAQHLAFWTGKHGERILALMQRSALVRDKWERESYILQTVRNACAWQTQVCQDKPVEPPPNPGGASSPTVTNSYTPVGQAVQGNTFVNPPEQLAVFEGCIYIEDAHRVLTPGGQLLKPDQFRVRYGGYTYVMDTTNTKTTKDAWECFTQSQAMRFPKASSTCFRPEQPPGCIVADAGRTLANTWFPIETPSEAGDIAPFLQHLEKLLPDARDRELLVTYMAAVVQHPGDKFQWWPVIQGVQGNGKTVLLNCLEEAVGHRYCHRPKAKELTASGTTFNAWMVGKVLVGIEEIKIGHRVELLEVLKDFVTNDRGEVQGKGADQVMGDNRANGILFTNHKDGMPQQNNERRYANFYTAQQAKEHLARDGMDGDYFPKLWAWLRAEGFKHITHWLQHYVIKAELSPAVRNGGHLHRAPETSSTAEALRMGLGRVEQDILEAIEQGQPGFVGGWVSSMALDRLLDGNGTARMLPRNKRREVLEGLGYFWHPGLPDGRVNNIILPDGGKPRLFIHRDSPLKVLQGPAAIAAAYESVQLVTAAKPGLALVPPPPAVVPVEAVAA